MLCVYVQASHLSLSTILTQHTVLIYPHWFYLNKIDMVAGASCSLHLSLLYSDEIILTFSQKHEKSSRAYLTTTALSIILHVKSEVLFILACAQYRAAYLMRYISKNNFLPCFEKVAYKRKQQDLVPFIHHILFNNITFALQGTINIRYIWKNIF